MIKIGLSLALALLCVFYAAQNVANLATPGYRAESMLFVEHLKQTEPGEKVRFVQDIATLRDLKTGPITHTGNTFDLAIAGRGYFTVETAEGPRYTRGGGFTLDLDGGIVSARGDALLDDGGAPLSVPPDAGEIVVARDGTVSGDDGEIGRIALVTFDNEQALVKRAAGLYDAGAQAPLPVVDPNIQQGKLEGSNATGVIEMTKLIDTVRSYQHAARLADEEHQRQRRAIDSLAGVQG